MTYDFAVTEATRRQRELRKDYAIVYPELGGDAYSFMVIPLTDAMQRNLLIVEKLIIH